MSADLRGTPHLLSVGVDLARLPADARARLAAAAGQPGDLLDRLADRAGEALLLATCARFELVGVTTTRCDRNGLASFLAESAGTSLDAIGPVARRRSGSEVVRHLARVAAGLESPVLGEPEILGQVRRAGELAGGLGTLGPVLSQAVTTALRAGRRARAETALARGTVELGGAAVERAAEALGGIRGRRAIVVGAGAIGSRVAELLVGRGARVTVINRTAATATALADRLGAEWREWTALADLLRASDLAVFATAAAEPLVRADALAAPLVVIDLGAPGNVLPTSGPTVVVLHDLAAIEAARRDAADGRAGAVEAAGRIVEEEVRRFERWRRRRVVSPVIASLIARGNEIVAGEVSRAISEDGSLDREAALRRLADRIVARVLDRPLRRLATEADGVALARSVGRLFELESAAEPVAELSEAGA